MLKFIIKGEQPLSYFDQQVDNMKKGTAGIILNEINKLLGRQGGIMQNKALNKKYMSNTLFTEKQRKRKRC